MEWCGALGIPTRTILELQNGNGTEPWPSRNCAGSPVERAIRVFLLIKRILVSPRSLQALKISAGIFANMPVTQNKDCQLTAGSSPRAFKYHQWMGSRGFWLKGDPGSPLPGDGTHSLRNARSGIQGGARAARMMGVFAAP